MQGSLLQQLLPPLQRQAMLMQQVLRTRVQQQQQVGGLTVTVTMAMRVTLRMMTHSLSRPAARETVKRRWRSGRSASSSSSRQQQCRLQHCRQQREQQQQLVAGSQPCATSSSEGLLLCNSALRQQQQVTLGGLACQLVCRFTSRCQQAWGRLWQCSS
jgi:hypothetical protein